MTYTRLHNRICKICALVAVTSILPSLAYADRDNGKAYKDGDHGQRWGDHDSDRDRDRHIPNVPEGGPGLVLFITTIGAILVFSPLAKVRADTCDPET